MVRTKPEDAVSIQGEVNKFSGPKKVVSDTSVVTLRDC